MQVGFNHSSPRHLAVFEEGDLNGGEVGGVQGRIPPPSLLWSMAGTAVLLLHTGRFRGKRPR